MNLYSRFRAICSFSDLKRLLLSPKTWGLGEKHVRWPGIGIVPLPILFEFIIIGKVILCLNVHPSNILLVDVCLPIFPAWMDIVLSIVRLPWASLFPENLHNGGCHLVKILKTNIVNEKTEVIPWPKDSVWTHTARSTVCQGSMDFI
jgi:hypothetical protein